MRVGLDAPALVERQPRTVVECGRRAGMGGVWVTPLFRGRIAKNPNADQLVRSHLRRGLAALKKELEG